MDTKLQNLDRAPKYCKGKYIRYNKQKYDEFINLAKVNPNILIPPTKLYVWCDPIWNGCTWLYYYDYGYGGLSEGCAIEEDVESCESC